MVAVTETTMQHVGRQAGGGGGGGHCNASEAAQAAVTVHRLIWLRVEGGGKNTATDSL